MADISYEEYPLYGEDSGPEHDCGCDPCVCECSDTNLKQGNEAGEEEAACICDPCLCETPPGSPIKTLVGVDALEGRKEGEVEDEGDPFQLDEFTRAKAFFMETSTKSGLSLYDHLTEVVRKLLDRRAPKNAVDYIEEISMNVKRYKFQPPPDVLQDVFYISPPVLEDAKLLNENWKTYSQWYEEGKEVAGEGFAAGSFSNLLRLQYYLEQVNIGLPREEMFRLALAIKDLTASRPFITKARFWGKVFGTRKNYYVIEADLNEPKSGEADIWQPVEETSAELGENVTPAQTEEAPPPDDRFPGAIATFEKAKGVVLNAEILSAYSKAPGAKGAPSAAGDPGAEWGGEDAPAEGAAAAAAAGAAAPPTITTPLHTDSPAEQAKWKGYQEELMSKLPLPPEQEADNVEVPPEDDGTGLNRRAFYVCNEIGQPWILLPRTTPKQVTASRRIRWALTGELEAGVKTLPEFPGKEGHLLRTMLARISAGSLISPKGFYRSSAAAAEQDEEDDDEIVEDEEDEYEMEPGDDKVFAVKRYRPPMESLINPELTFWVHHACAILPQGRSIWWDPSKGGKQGGKSGGDEETEEEEDDEDFDDEFEGEGNNDGQGAAKREVAPQLFSPISEDVGLDGRQAWTLVTSSSVFKEFQVVSVRSNTWPGSQVICTVKGKVDNIYLGDGIKFSDRSYAPFMPTSDEIMKEYKTGPELEDLPDPAVEEEQKYLSLLEAQQTVKLSRNDENEYDGEEEDEEEEEEEGEYTEEEM